MDECNHQLRGGFALQLMLGFNGDGMLREVMEETLQNDKVNSAKNVLSRGQDHY